MKNQKSKYFPTRGVFSAILSFLLSFFIGLLSLALVLQFTLLSSGYFKKQILDSNYVVYCLEELREGFISYGLASGFEEEFCASLVTEEQLKTDILQEVSALYAEGADSYDEQVFEEELYQKLVENAKSQNIAVDGENETAVRRLAQEYVKMYTEYTEFPVDDMIAELLQKAKLPILCVGGGAIALIVFSAVLLSTFYRRKYKFIAHCVYALGGSALLLGVPSAIVLFSGIISRLGVLNQGLYFLLQEFLGGILGGMLIAAAVLLVLAVALFFVYRCMRKQFIRTVYGEEQK